ncbi:MAG: hypothetical protein IJA55_01705 [Clostridia bacterium]|nr:hypothetical protein [Clostridia bacterium]
MKKIIALLLTIVLAISVVACTKKTETPETPENNEPTLNTEANDTDDKSDNETEEVPEAPAANSESVAQALVSEFKQLTTDPSLDAQAIADALASSNVLSPIGVLTMPMEQGVLNGFGNYEVKGFTECVTFAPMIGSIAFVGYVFTVGDGVDANAFASDLEANADLRWNICVAADEVATATEGNKVMFVMAPMSFDAGQPDDMVQDDMDVDMGDVEIPAAFDGEMAE